MEKNKWYDFRLLFRRDKNFWDYNLSANPYNPAALNPAGSLTTGCYVGPPTAAFPQGAPAFCSSPAVAQNNSLHDLDLVRYMQDYDLTLFPQSADPCEARVFAKPGYRAQPLYHRWGHDIRVQSDE